jgi:prevent-host-death family protein
MARWQLQDAKNRLSEVVRKASDEGPQVITLRGDDAVVVIAADEYARLTLKTKGTLVDFLRKSPLASVTFDLTRSRDTSRRAAL